MIKISPQSRVFPSKEIILNIKPHFKRETLKEAFICWSKSLCLCKSNHCTISESECGNFIDSFQCGTVNAGGGWEWGSVLLFWLFWFYSLTFQGLATLLFILPISYFSPTLLLSCFLFLLSLFSWNCKRNKKKALTCNFTFYSDYCRLNFLKTVYFR